MSPLNTPRMRKHILRTDHRKWLSGLVFLACLSGCGGGSSASQGAPALPSTPQATPALPPAPTPLPRPGTTPTAAFNCAADAITCIEVASTSSQAQPSLPVTFGQPFKAGDWRHATQGLVAKVNGATIPLQTDEISSHRDGSARFAVLSAQLNNIQPGEARIINLYAGPKASSTSNVPADPDWNLEVEAQVYDAGGNVTATLVAQPQAQLKSQIASHNGQRLNGPVASEYTVVTDFKNKATGATHPHLSARFHTRLVDGGARIRTDVVMENTRTWTNAPGNITYSMAIKRNGVTLHNQPKFTHYHHARWHKVVWTGSSAQPQVRVRHQMPYFMASRITWNYDLNVKVNEGSLQNEVTQLANANTAPMGTAMLDPYFPSTGGRSDIGPLPRWTALYLVSQDDRAYRSMMAIADAAAGVPVHYRDEKTSLPLDVETHPKVSVRFGTSNPAVPNSQDSTVWTPDTAHQASFAYIPYVITGDAFYLDELLFWSAWNIAGVDPNYREGSKGLIHANELRAQAWVMRSIAESAWATPDSHPMKAYFATRLENNTAYYKKAFPNAIGESPMGMISWSQEHASVWQNDYFSIVLSLLAENGEPDARDALNWFSRFTVGRFLNDSNGFCAARAPGGYWINRVNMVYVSTWRDLFNLNYPADAGKDCSTLTVTEGYPDWGGGYAASARAMLGATANAGIPGAKEAYARWKSMTPQMDANIAQGEPTWVIVPR